MSINFSGNDSGSIMANAWNKLEQKINVKDDANEIQKKQKTELIKSYAQLTGQTEEAAANFINELLKPDKDNKVDIAVLKNLYEATLLSEGKTGLDKTVELNNFDTALKIEAHRFKGQSDFVPNEFHIRFEKLDAGSASANFVLDTNDKTDDGTIMSKDAQLQKVSEVLKSSKVEGNLGLEKLDNVEPAIKDKTIDKLKTDILAKQGTLMGKDLNDLRLEPAKLTEFIESASDTSNKLKEIYAVPGKNTPELKAKIDELDKKFNDARAIQGKANIETVLSDTLGGFFNFAEPDITMALLQSKFTAGVPLGKLLESVDTPELQKVVSQLLEKVNDRYDLTNFQMAAEILASRPDLIDNFDRSTLAHVITLVDNKGLAEKFLNALNTNDKLNINDKKALVEQLKAKIAAMPDGQVGSKQLNETNFKDALKHSLDGWHDDSALMFAQSIINGEVPASLLNGLTPDETVKLFSIVKAKSSGDIDNLARRFVEGNNASFAQVYKKLSNDDSVSNELVKALLSNEKLVSDPTKLGNILKQFSGTELVGMLNKISDQPELLGVMCDKLKQSGKFVEVVNNLLLQKGEVDSNVKPNIQKAIIGALNVTESFPYEKFEAAIKGMKDVGKLFKMADGCETGIKDNFYINALKAGVVDTSKLTTAQQNKVVDIMLNNEPFKKDVNLLTKTFNEIPATNTEALAKLKDKLLDANDDMTLDISKITDLNKMFNGVKNEPYNLKEVKEGSLVDKVDANNQVMTTTQLNELMKLVVNGSADISKLSKDNMKALGEKLLAQPAGETKVDDKTASLIKRFGEVNKDNIGLIGDLAKKEGPFNPRVAILATGLDGKTVAEKNPDIATLLTSAMMHTVVTPNSPIRGEDVTNFATEISQAKNGKAILDEGFESVGKYAETARALGQKPKADGNNELIVEMPHDISAEKATAKVDEMQKMFKSLLGMAYPDKPELDPSKYYQVVKLEAPVVTP